MPQCPIRKQQQRRRQHEQIVNEQVWVDQDRREDQSGKTSIRWGVRGASRFAGPCFTLRISTD